MNQAGTRATYFDKPGVVQALQYWVDLSRKYKIQPKGTIEWGTTPKDFFERKTAIMWTSTGNLTNVRTNAKFPFGVAMLPAQQGRRFADRRRQFLSVQENDRSKNAPPPSNSSSG